EQTDKGDPNDRHGGSALVAEPNQARPPHSHRNTALIVGVTVTSLQKGMLISRGWTHETRTSLPASPSAHPSGYLFCPFTVIEKGPFGEYGWGAPWISVPGSQSLVGGT